MCISSPFVKNHQKLFNILVILPIAICADIAIMIIVKSKRAKQKGGSKMELNTLLAIVGAVTVGVCICKFGFWLDK